jgi:hypothetical protein
VKLGPLGAGVTQLLDLKSTPTSPLPATSPVGLTVVRVE